jgi:hypothetical protein
VPISPEKPRLTSDREEIWSDISSDTSATSVEISSNGIAIPRIKKMAMSGHECDRIANKIHNLTGLALAYDPVRDNLCTCRRAELLAHCSLRGVLVG